jgi:hypothetical protein
MGKISFSDIKHLSSLIIIIKIIIHILELRKIYNDSNLSNKKLIEKFTHAKDFIVILYNLFTYNLVGFISNIIPKYFLIIKFYRKIKDKIKNRNK